MTVIALPVFDVPIACINQAAVMYHVPAKLIISVLQTEGGKMGKIEKNKNGTYDIGAMQINSSWLPELKSEGISQDDIQYNACTNVSVGTWILAKKIAAENNLLVGVGDYNSHTSQYNKTYYHKVQRNFTKLSLILA
jgi:soluble lytic murein transglycosylase-like protein